MKNVAAVFGVVAAVGLVASSAGAGAALWGGVQNATVGVLDTTTNIISSIGTGPSL